MPLITPEYERLVHRIEYRTDVITAWSSAENRIALLDAPRESWDLEFYPDTTTINLLRRELFQDPVTAWTLPLRYEGVPSQNAVTSTTVTIDTTYMEPGFLNAGETVLIEGPAGDRYTRTVSSAAGPTSATVVTLSSGPAAGSYPAGLTMFYPVKSVLLDSAGALTRYQQDGGRWAVRCSAASFGATLGTGGATLTTHGGYDVLDVSPIMRDTVEETFVTGMTRHDYGAKIQQEWAYGQAPIQRSHLFNAQTTADRQWWKKWLHARKGKQKLFLLPTGRTDLVLTTNPPSGTSLVVRDTEQYVQMYFPSLAHRYLRLTQADGGTEYKTVTNAVDNGNGTQTLTVSSSVSGESITKISFCELARQATDMTELVYSTDGLFQLAYHVMVTQR